MFCSLVQRRFNMYPKALSGNLHKDLTRLSSQHAKKNITSIFRTEVLNNVIHLDYFCFQNKSTELLFSMRPTWNIRRSNQIKDTKQMPDICWLTQAVEFLVVVSNSKKKKTKKNPPKYRRSKKHKVKTKNKLLFLFCFCRHSQALSPEDLIYAKTSSFVGAERAIR